MVKRSHVSASAFAALLSLAAASCDTSESETAPGGSAGGADGGAGSGGEGGAGGATGSGGGGPVGGASSTGGGGGSAGDGGFADLSGAAEKGPMLLGSSILVSSLDQNGTPTGSTYPTQTTDDLGAFQMSSLPAGPVEIQATGFYYDEIQSMLSVAPIALRAVDVLPSSVPHTTYLNVVTHMAHDRALALVSAGTTFPDATQQAEVELRQALPIGIAGFDPGAPGASMTELGGDTDASAYLLTVSSVLMNAAVRSAPDVAHVDATLQALLNNIAADLGNDGLLEMPVVAELVEAEASLDPASVMASFAQRLADLGSVAVVPDIERILDRDQDEVVDEQDNCPTTANPNQDDTNGDGLGDACSVPVCGDGYHLPGEICFVLTEYPIVPSSAPPWSFALLDLTGNGPRDLVLGGGAQAISVLPADVVNGGFMAPIGYATPGIFVGALGAGALDSTGLDDVVVRDANNCKVGALLDDGSGSLTSFVSSDVMLCGTPRFADYDLDGYGDVLVGSYNGVQLFKGDGTGALAAPIQVIPANGSMDIAIHDVNGDGAPDLVVGTNGTPSVMTYFGDGTGSFSSPIVTLLPANGIGGGRMAVGDINGDALLDVVVIFESEQLTMLALGNSDGTFQASTLSSSVPAQGVTIADLDGDGHRDVILAGGKLYVLRGDGAGGLASPEVVPNVVASGSVLVADMTDDGLPDLLSNAFISNQSIGLYRAGGY